MLSRLRKPKKVRPPRRVCRGCGTHVYSWTEAPLCGDCVQAVINAPATESMRDYRRRTIDPERNE